MVYRSGAYDYQIYGLTADGISAPVATSVTAAQLADGYAVTRDKDYNWYVIEMLGKNGNGEITQRRYASLAIYRDITNAQHEGTESSESGPSVGNVSSLLDDLSFSYPTVPMFDSETFAYFVSVPSAEEAVSFLAVAADQYHASTIRVRTIGGRDLYEANAARIASGADNDLIRVIRGENLVTVTMTAQRYEGSEVYNSRHVYIVELNRGWQKDTADIITMDHIMFTQDSGIPVTVGNMTPVWNCDRVNYFLNISYEDLMTYGNTLLLTPTQRPEEAPRGTMEVEVRNSKGMIVDQRMLHKSDDGLSYNTYLLSGLTAGETYSVLFISKVYVNERSEERRVGKECRL